MLKLVDLDVTCEDQISLGVGLHATLFQTEGAASDFLEAGRGNEEVADD